MDTMFGWSIHRISVSSYYRERKKRDFYTSPKSLQKRTSPFTLSINHRTENTLTLTHSLEAHINSPKKSPYMKRINILDNDININSITSLALSCAQCAYSATNLYILNIIYVHTCIKRRREEKKSNEKRKRFFAFTTANIVVCYV